MKQFLYFTSGVTWRVPVNEDGSYGNPELLRKWTSPMKETKSYKNKRIKPQELRLEIGESIEL